MTAGNLTNLWKDGSPGFVLVLSLNPEEFSAEVVQCHQL